MNNSPLDSAVAINNTTIIISLLFAISSYWEMKKRGLKGSNIFLLPSIIIPSLICLIYCAPLVWLSLDPIFKINFLKIENLPEASSIILIATFLITMGMIYGKRKVISYRYYRQDSRRMDAFFYGIFGKKLVVNLVLLACFVFPFCFALRLDLIFGEGIRHNLDDSSLFLILIIPFARIILLILSVVSGIIYSYRGEAILLLIPLLDTTQHLMKLSRGFFLPLVLFFIAASLSGKKFPKWLYFCLPIGGLVLGISAIAARGLSSFGIWGITSGIFHLKGHFTESIRNFFEANSMIGILTTTVSLREIVLQNPAISYVDGFVDWFLSILPTPSAFGLGAAPVNFAALMNIGHAGIPMPFISEIFFRMGWLGLLVFFLIGIIIGVLEGQMVKHLIIYGKAYWPHILLYLALLFGCLLSAHSASRAVTRYFMYSGMLIATIRYIFTQTNLIRHYEKQ